MVLPRSGDYEVEAWGRIGTPVANQQLYYGIANASVSSAVIGINSAVTIGNYDTAYVKTILTTLSQSQTLRVRYDCAVGNMSVDYRYIGLIPIRVA